MNTRISIQELKALANKCEMPHRLQHADASAVIENPLCGDEVLLEVQLKNNVVTAIGYDIKGCLLCGASAALLIELLEGATRAEVEALSEKLQASLKGESNAGSIEALEIFAGVREHPSRHDCVMLPFKAALAVLQP